MRFVYATDLHSSEEAYEQLIVVAREYRADAVILGGDLFAYSRRAAPQISFAREVLAPYLEILRLDGVHVLTIFGNCDLAATRQVLREYEREGLVTCLPPNPYRLADYSDLAIVGYGLVPPGPYRLKENDRRDLAADRYEGVLPIFVSSSDPEQMWVQAPGSLLDDLPSIQENLSRIPGIESPFLFVAHSPPRQILDRSHIGVNGGSRAIREWILDRRPLLSFHGHIHEAPDIAGTWAQSLGDMLCVNPGDSSSGKLQAVLGDTQRLPVSLEHTTRGCLGSV